MTPFGGADHDWSAIELAAWLAGRSRPRCGSSEPRPTTNAAAAMPAGYSPAPRYSSSRWSASSPSRSSSPPGKDGVLEQPHDARLLVIGLSDRWRTEGIGPARAAVAASARVPTLFVRRGLRPGGIAPSETLTRFTWTLGSS